MAAQARLTVDADLRVLWLTQGSQELALSAGGLYLACGRRSVDLPWDEIEQVQSVAPRGRAGRERRAVEVFVTDGHVHVIGPFPAPVADRWVRAAAQAAAGVGRPVRRLAGADGFRLAP